MVDVLGPFDAMREQKVGRCLKNGRLSSPELLRE